MRNRTSPPARVIFKFFIFLFLAAAALAQGQKTLSATSNCGIALVHQAVAIDDGGYHSISLDQRACSFENPTELSGSRIVKYVSSGVDDVQFDQAKDQGYVVGETANGDKYFLRYEGTAALKDAIPLHLEGTWKFTGGTGRLRGLSGQGTYRGQPTSSGGMMFKLEGSYQVEGQP